MTSLMNEILYNPKLSDTEKIELIKQQFEKSSDVKKLIDDGNLESNYFEKDKEIIYKECEAEYNPIIWSDLTEQSKMDLKNAYLYSAFIKKFNDDESTPLNKLTKTVENELKDKIFKAFIKDIVNSNLEIANKDDEIFDKCVFDFKEYNELKITLTTMLIFIKISGIRNPISNYANELNNYFRNNRWNLKILYSKRNEDYYIQYPEKYRNPYAHGGITYDETLTDECKKDTKEILTWLISSSLNDI